MSDPYPYPGRTPAIYPGGFRTPYNLYQQQHTQANAGQRSSCKGGGLETVSRLEPQEDR